MSDTEKPEGGDVSENEKPSEESKAEETKAEETKAEETKAEEPKAEETKAEETKAEEPKAEEPKAEETKAEEPKAEEPKAEEPKAEEAKAEEPKAEEAEEPKSEEPKAEEAEEPKSAAEKVLEEKSAAEKVIEDSKAEEPKAEEPKAEEPKAEEPKAEEPKAEEPKAEEPKAEEPKAEEPKAEEPVGEPVDEEPPAPTPESEPAAEPAHLGVLVEFENEDSLMHACEQVRDAGYSHWDAHTPYPVHGLDQAMGIRPTILPWLIVGGGLTGAMAGLFLQLYTNGIQLPFSLADIAILDPFIPSGYPFVTSGKPIFSVPANIPVTFELTILLSAFAAFFGMWGLNKLPKWYHPVFNSERFKRATQDRFFISILKDDPLYDAQRTRALADRLGGSFVEELTGEEG